MHHSNPMMGQFTSCLVSRSSSTKQSTMVSGRSHGGSKNLSDIPLDIILDILSRLPAHILVRLKSVCKLWKNLIGGHYFIDLHLSKWMHKPPSCLILTPYRGLWNTTKSLYFVDGIEKGSCRARQLQVEYLAREKFLLYGCCNGLISIAPLGRKLDPIFICNPITGESMYLPKSNIVDEIIHNIADETIGFRFCPLNYYTIDFGFDHATKKYKVVRLLGCEKKDHQQLLLCEVITLGESSWRKLDVQVPVPADEYIGFSPMLFLNGFVYWISCGWGLVHEFILAYDISNEKFDTINIPFLGQDNISSQLINMEGSLALVTLHFDPNSSGVKISKTWQIAGSKATGFWFKKYPSDVCCHGKDGTRYAWLSDGTSLIRTIFERSLSFAWVLPSTGFPQVFEREPLLFMPTLVSLP